MPGQKTRQSRLVYPADTTTLFFDHFGLSPSARDPLLLQRIVLGFSKIPYENLSKIIRSWQDGRQEQLLRLPPEVMQDHIDHHLGGTCFSLAFFLDGLLRSLGFECHKIMADMRAGSDIHCAVVVRKDSQSLLVDPGYGLNRPMPLREGSPVRFLSRQGGVELIHEPEKDRFHLYTSMARERKWRYSFANEPVSDKDFERYWIESFSKPTLNQICLYRVSQQGHLYLRKHHLRVSNFRGQRKDNIRENLHQTVKTHFGIEPRWVEEAADILSERRAQRGKT